MNIITRLNGYLRHSTTTGLQLDEMDAFRGWACLGVVFTHCLGDTSKSFETWPLDAKKLFVWPFKQGGYGVDLFFFLSGFLLFLSFGKAYYEGRTEPHKVAFYKRRLLRILPAYYANLVLVILLWIAVYSKYEYFELEPGNLASHLFFVHNLFSEYANKINSVMWTLPVEMQYYLILPFMANWFYGKRSLISVPVIIFGCFLFKYYALSLNGWHNPPSLALPPYNSLAWNIDKFAIGMGFANLWLSLRNKQGFPFKDKMHYVAALGFIIVIAAMEFRMRYRLVPIGSYLTPVATCGGFGLFVLGIIFSPGLKKLVCNPLIQFVGIISYSLYLWHLQVIVSLELVFPSLREIGIDVFIERIAVALPLSILVATVSYMLFEKPFLSRKKAITPTVEST